MGLHDLDQGALASSQATYAPTKSSKQLPASKEQRWPQCLTRPITRAMLYPSTRAQPPSQHLHFSEHLSCYGTSLTCLTCVCCQLQRSGTPNDTVQLVNAGNHGVCCFRSR